MTYPRLHLASILVGLAAGLIVFSLLSVFRDSFAAAQDLDIARAKGGVSALVILPGLAMGCLWQAAAPRVTDYAGSALLPPLLLTVAVAIALSVALVHTQLSQVRAPLDGLAVLSCLVMLTAALVTGWINR